MNIEFKRFRLPSPIALVEYECDDRSVANFPLIFFPTLSTMTTSPRPWLPIPSPIRRLFTSFPLQTFPPAPLPSSSPPPTSLPRLYVLTADPLGPSWDAESLKWQVNPRPVRVDCLDIFTGRMG
jgi:hypothetical protein